MLGSMAVRCCGGSRLRIGGLSRAISRHSTRSPSRTRQEVFIFLLHDPSVASFMTITTCPSILAGPSPILRNDRVHASSSRPLSRSFGELLNNSNTSTASFSQHDSTTSSMLTCSQPSDTPMHACTLIATASSRRNLRVGRPPQRAIGSVWQCSRSPHHIPSNTRVLQQNGVIPRLVRHTP